MPPDHQPASVRRLAKVSLEPLHPPAPDLARPQAAVVAVLQAEAEAAVAVVVGRLNHFVPNKASNCRTITQNNPPIFTFTIRSIW